MSKVKYIKGRPTGLPLMMLWWTLDVVLETVENVSKAFDATCFEDSKHDSSQQADEMLTVARRER